MISIDRLKEIALEDIENNPEKHLEEHTELLQQLNQLKTSKEQAEQKLERIRDIANELYESEENYEVTGTCYEILQIIDEVKQ